MPNELPKWQKLPGDAGDIHVDFDKVPVNAYVTFKYPECPDERPFVVVRRGRYGLMLTENMAKDLLAELAAGFGYSLATRVVEPPADPPAPPSESAPVWTSPCGRAIVHEASRQKGSYLIFGECCAPMLGEKHVADVGGQSFYDSPEAAIKAAKKRLLQMDMENTDGHD